AAQDALAEGANVHALDTNRQSSLHLACIHGHIPLAELLVSHGADVNQVFGKRRQSLLHWSAEHNACGMANFLLTHGATVNSQQSDGSTPLLLASKHGHHYLVKLLLKHNALISPRNASQATARSIAHREGHTTIVGLIDAASESRPAHLQAAEQEFNAPHGERYLF
ncbi:MAG TPA: ankyrin repeat domain-containing protein, partial [Planctomycetaceae bacterium]|nr:ankyrin repeat domain-containing protein [Planctomycetaceae bacterium]